MQPERVLSPHQYIESRVMCMDDFKFFDMFKQELCRVINEILDSAPDISRITDVRLEENVETRLITVSATIETQ